MKKLNFPPAVVHVLLFSLLLAWTVAGCDAGTLISPTSEPPPPILPATCPKPETDGKSIAFTTLVQGYRLSAAPAAPAEPALFLAVDATGLEALASIVDTKSQELVGEVKVDRQAVLAASWGMRPSGGGSITICGISIDDSNITVSVILQENDPNVPRIDAATYPYHLVLIDRLDLPEARLHYRLVSDAGLLAEGDIP